MQVFNQCLTAASPARDYSTHDQPIFKPDQKLLIGSGYWLPRHCLGHQHSAQPNWASGGVYCHCDDGVPQHVAGDIDVYELVQQAL